MLSQQALAAGFREQAVIHIDEASRLEDEGYSITEDSPIDRLDAQAARELMLADLIETALVFA